MKVTLVCTLYIYITGWDCQPHAQPPTWRTRVSLLVRVTTFELSGTWCHTSSVTTASTVLRIIWPHNPHHCVKVGIPRWGATVEICLIVKTTQNKTLYFRSNYRWNCSPEEATNGNHLCKCRVHKRHKFIITILQSKTIKYFNFTNIQNKTVFISHTYHASGYIYIYSFSFIYMPCIVYLFFVFYLIISLHTKAHTRI